jgi:DNA-binding response OmpR family regulator
MAEKLGTTPPKILVVGNQESIAALREIDLRPEKLDVLLESIPANTIQRWEQEIPDLIILDLNLSEDALLELVKRLRAGTLIPILLLTSSSNERFVLDAYKSGVDECIHKSISTALFKAKIKVWLRRSWAMAASTLDPLRIGKFHLFPSERTIIVDDEKPVRLTNLELRLLYFLMGRPNRAVSVEELNQRVWGYTSEMDNTMLKNVVYRLRNKIESNPAKPRFIQTIPGVGYKLSVE